jgi:aquaporin Z
MSIAKRALAEGLGTGWLVLGGCGSAVISAAIPQLGIGILGVALAFGLTVVTMAYVFGPISGCHLNPAVSLGLWAGKRFSARELLPYIVAQVIGAIIGAGILYVIATGSTEFTPQGGFATNGYGVRSPAGYTLLACFITEVVMTFFFLIIIMGATDNRAPKGFAPLAIGLGLTLIHLISIPVTNTSVNPARSTGPALFVGGGAISQLWLFWLAPILGALIAGWVYNYFWGKEGG